MYRTTIEDPKTETMWQEKEPLTPALISLAGTGNATHTHMHIITTREGDQGGG